MSVNYTDKELKQASDQTLWGLYDSHDCHASPEDGCTVCDEVRHRFGLRPRKVKTLEEALDLAVEPEELPKCPRCGEVMKDVWETTSDQGHSEIIGQKCPECGYEE